MSTTRPGAAARAASRVVSPVPQPTAVEGRPIRGREAHRRPPRRRDSGRASPSELTQPTGRRCRCWPYRRRTEARAMLAGEARLLREVGDQRPITSNPRATPARRSGALPPSLARSPIRCPIRIPTCVTTNVCTAISAITGTTGRPSNPSVNPIARSSRLIDTPSATDARTPPSSSELRSLPSSCSRTCGSRARTAHRPRHSRRRSRSSSRAGDQARDRRAASQPQTRSTAARFASVADARDHGDPAQPRRRTSGVIRSTVSHEQMVPLVVQRDDGVDDHDLLARATPRRSPANARGCRSAANATRRSSRARVPRRTSSGSAPGAIASFCITPAIRQ